MNFSIYHKFQLVEIDSYHAYVQNVDAGAYSMVAKGFEVTLSTYSSKIITKQIQRNSINRERMYHMISLCLARERRKDEEYI